MLPDATVKFTFPRVGRARGQSESEQKRISRSLEAWRVHTCRVPISKFANNIPGLHTRASVFRDMFATLRTCFAHAHTYVTCMLSLSMSSFNENWRYAYKSTLSKLIVNRIVFERNARNSRSFRSSCSKFIWWYNSYVIDHFRAGKTILVFNSFYNWF